MAELIDILKCRVGVHEVGEIQGSQRRLALIRLLSG